MWSEVGEYCVNGIKGNREIYCIQERRSEFGQRTSQLNGQRNCVDFAQHRSILVSYMYFVYHIYVYVNSLADYTRFICIARCEAEYAH